LGLAAILALGLAATLAFGVVFPPLWYLFIT
jgi:hypothetical protein